MDRTQRRGLQVPDCIASMILQPQQVHTGQFRLSEAEDRRRRDGATYKQVLLDDATGSLRGLIRPGAQVQTYEVPTAPCAVETTLRTQFFNGVWYAQVSEWKSIGPEDIRCGASLLPHRLCPDTARRALAELVLFQQSLKPIALNRFLSRVLLDPAIGVPFMRCKGSQNHHHAQPGCLLIHSVEPLGLVRQMTLSALPRDPDAAALTQVGYLLHDLGKIRTVGCDHRPEDGRHLRHEFWTGQLLANHLMWLEARWPDGARVLRYLLDYLDQSPQQRGYAKFLGAEVIVAVDHLDVAASRGRGVDALRGRTVAPRTTSATDQPPLASVAQRAVSMTSHP